MRAATASRRRGTSSHQDAHPRHHHHQRASAAPVHPACRMVAPLRLCPQRNPHLHLHGHGRSPARRQPELTQPAGRACPAAALLTALYPIWISPETPAPTPTSSPQRSPSGGYPYTPESTSANAMPTRRTLALSAVFFSLCTFRKETAIITPVALALWEATQCAFATANSVYRPLDGCAARAHSAASRLVRIPPTTAPASSSATPVSPLQHLPTWTPAPHRALPLPPFPAPHAVPEHVRAGDLRCRRAPATHHIHARATSPPRSLRHRCHPARQLGRLLRTRRRAADALSPAHVSARSAGLRRDMAMPPAALGVARGSQRRSLPRRPLDQPTLRLRARGQPHLPRLHRPPPARHQLHRTELTWSNRPHRLAGLLRTRTPRTRLYQVPHQGASATSRTSPSAKS